MIFDAFVVSTNADSLSVLPSYVCPEKAIGKAELETLPGLEIVANFESEIFALGSMSASTMSEVDNSPASPV